MDYTTTYSRQAYVYGHAPPTDYEINNYDHVIFTSDVAWELSIMDNETDLGILNNNLNLNRGDLHLGARLLDNGEKSTQRIIANMLTKNCYGVKPVSYTHLTLPTIYSV